MDQDRADATQRTADLETALRVLSRLVRDEYPDGRTLTEIVMTWDQRATSHEKAALHRVESAYVGMNSS